MVLEISNCKSLLCLRVQHCLDQRCQVLVLSLVQMRELRDQPGAQEVFLFKYLSVLFAKTRLEDVVSSQHVD